MVIYRDNTYVMAKFLLLLICILLLTTTNGAYEECVTTLRNIVVYEGTLGTILGCSTGPNGSAWSVRPTSKALTANQITNFNDVISPTLTNLYAINGSGLIVRNATITPTDDPISTAGLYFVRFPGTTNQTAAKLVVIHSGPNCSCIQLASDAVNISCNIVYADHPLAPIREIINCTANGQVYTSTTPNRTQISTFHVYNSTSTITINNTAPATYDCKLTFTSPSASDLAEYPYLARNAPDFSASFTVCNRAASTTQMSATYPPTAFLPPKSTINTSISAFTTTTQSVTTTSRPAQTTKAFTTTTQSVTTTSRPAQTTKAATFKFFVEPTFGPIAGGTKVTVICQWSDLSGTSSAVYFGSHLLGQIITRSGLNVTVLTPPVDESAIGQLLPISVEIIPGSFNVSTNTYFTYAPNPEVHDVNPKRLTLSGGIRLNISGSNLSSVARPVMRALVVVKRISGSFNNHESFEPCEPSTEAGTKMTCLSPPIYIPDDFLPVLFDSKHSPYTNEYRRRRAAIDSIKTNSRRKREIDVNLYTNKTYLGKNNQDRLNIYIGVVFDGYLRYFGDILRDNPAPFEIFFPPNLTCPDESDFDPNTDEFIKIKGEEMSICCNADSYVIHLGNDFCNFTDLTDNQLTCKPPKTKPEQTQADIDFCGQNIAILVEVGYRKYKCSCLKYTESSVTKLITIIVATVGSSLVFFIVIILTSVIIRRVKNSKKKPTQDAQVNNTRSKKEISLKSRRPETDRRGLTSDVSNNDLQAGRDDYQSYINSSEGDSYRGQSYNGHYARTLEGSDHSGGKYKDSDDHEDYLERNNRGYYRSPPGNGNGSVRGNRRGNWNEGSYRGRRLNDELPDDFYYGRFGGEMQNSPRRYFNQDRSYVHRMKY